MSTSFSKLRVCGHRVMVKLLDVEEKFGGSSLIIKDPSLLHAERNAAQEAIVIEVGETAFNVFGGNPWCKVGDHVLVTRYNGVKQEDCDNEDDRKYRIMLDENILGVFTDE